MSDIFIVNTNQLDMILMFDIIQSSIYKICVLMGNLYNVYYT